MKKILFRNIEGEWRDSDLDFELETASFNNIEDYLKFRNTVSSLTLYEIVEFQVNPEEDIYSLASSFRDFEEWDEKIVLLGSYFINIFSRVPNILLANIDTLEKIDQIVGETSAMSTFNNKDFSLKICVDNELNFGEFVILNDEEAEFSNNNEEIIIIGHEVLVKMSRYIEMLKLGLNSADTEDFKIFIQSLEKFERKHLLNIIKEQMNSGLIKETVATISILKSLKN